MNLKEVVCKIECHDLLVRFCTALDTGANEVLADFVTEDVVLSLPTGDKVGAEAQAFLRARSKSPITRHIMTNTIITPTGADTARGEAYILVYRVPGEPEAALPRKLPSTPQGAGNWVVHFRKTTGGWRMSRYMAIEYLRPAE